MKHLGKFSLGMMALLLASCSNDEPIPAPDNGNNGAKDVYASLTLRMPAGTRDGNNGYEVGSDVENNVGTIYVVLATKEGNTYKFLTSAMADAGLPTQSGTEVKYVLNFSSTDLSPNPIDKPADQVGEDQEVNGSYIPGTTPVYVFAYCNPSLSLQERLRNLKKDNTFTSFTGRIEDKDNAVMWQDNKFLMTNCDLAEVDGGLPSREELLTHNSPDKALQLGTVNVKRAAARFDFMAKEAVDEKGLNVYYIKDLTGTKDLGYVQLTDMAMFNICREFYYLPRTNANWSWTGTTNLCGNLEGFVMSENAGGWRTASRINTQSLGDRFYSVLINNPLGSSSSSLKWTSIRDWNQKADSDAGWNGGKDEEGNVIPSESTDYRVWRYTTENTIPSGGTDAATGTQKIGITTGVVFRGEFVPYETETWNGDAIYTHNNIIYGNFNALKKYCTDNPETAVAADFNSIFDEDKTVTDLKVSQLKGLSDQGAFKCYEAVKVGDEYRYIMYYFYYNRHKSNGDPANMGINEFGVVRNNVYKLYVNSIAYLGETEAPDNPDNPDEEEKAYFSVNCIVLPWTVRVNPIDF